MVKYTIKLHEWKDDKEIREYFLKKIERLCLESIKKGTFFKKDSIYWPTYEQEEFYRKKLGWYKKK